jgi:HEAT repeat protein
MAAFRFFLVLCLALSTTSAWSDQERPQAKPQNKEWVHGGLTANQWTEIARDKTALRREEAIRVLAMLKPDGLTVKEWIEIAREKTCRQSRAEAIEVLGGMKPAAKAAIPILVEALKDKSVRSLAVDALGQMHTADDEIVTQLLEVMKDKSTLPYACSVLATLGPLVRSTVPALVKMTEGTDSDARDRASYALASILPDSKFAAWSELRALGVSPPNHSAAISSMARFPPEAVVAACIDALTRETPRLRLIALEVLIDMGPRAVAAGPAVAKTLDDKNRAVRKSAVFALMRLGMRERLPIRTLAILLKDDDIEVRVYSATILRRAGPEAREALPALVEALADQDSGVRGQAAFALAAIGPPAVPKLIEALTCPSVDTRRLAVFALGKIGPEAAKARPALTLLLKDADAEVRLVAAESLGKISQKTGR